MADAASTAQTPTREKMNRSKTFGCSLEKHMLAFVLRTVPIDRLLQGEKICKEKTENHSNGSANRNRKTDKICKSQTINYTNRDRTTEEIQSTLNRVKNSTMIYRRQQNHAKATAHCNRIGRGRVKGYE